MILGLRAVIAALGQVVTHLLVVVVANLTAVVLSLPVILVLGIAARSAHSFSLLPLGITIFLGVLPNPAAAGLQGVARDIADGQLVGLRDQWQGFKRYAVPAARTWFTAAGVSVVIILNVLFYGGAIGGPHLPSTAAAALETLWFSAFLIWLAAHLYVFPLLMLQDDRRLRVTYRNAFLVTAARPVFTGFVAAVWLGFLLLTSAVGLAALIGLAFGAAIQQNAFSAVLPSLQPPRAHS